MFRITLTLLLLSYFHSGLFSQQFHFQRRINPFPVNKQNGTPYDFPFLGGLNRPMQQLVDIDGNNTPDLFIQDRAAQLMYLKNIGTPSAFQFQWITDQFEDLPVGEWFKFADVDNDQDMDLFAESPFGIIRYYRNVGSPNNPNFVLGVDTLRDDTGSPIVVDALSVPDWADIDCDGELELFLGRLTGQITLYDFTGFDSHNLPLYHFVTDTFQGLVIITGGGKASPSGVSPAAGNELHGANSLTFVDIDNDTDNDIFWGDFFAQSLIFLQNSGSCSTPNIDITMEQFPPSNPIQTGGYNVPRFADIDGDGDFDMFVGVLGGSISNVTNQIDNFYYYENTGTPSQYQFVLRSTQFLNILDIGKNINPALVDIDGDGDLDMFLANEVDLNSPGRSNSRLYFFENQGSAQIPDFHLVNSHYLNYDKPNFDANYAPAFVDIDDDEDQDLILGKWSGKLTFWRNDGTPVTPNFVRVDEFYAGIDVGNFSTPTFVDIDADGDFDLFIGENSGGANSGRINFYQNDGTPSSPQFNLVTETYAGIDFGIGEFLNPFFIDIDEDQDFDLIVGTTTLGPVLFRNIGTPQSADFVQDTSFHFPLHLQTAPRMADIDSDGDLDLLMGVEGGGVVYYENQQVTGINHDRSSAQLPVTAQLLGNYPNPFNPLTIINYQLTIDNWVILKIYDILGREVKTLVNKRQSPGSYTVRWDGKDDTGKPVASGVYLYRLHVGNFVQTRKMLLLR